MHLSKPFMMKVRKCWRRHSMKNHLLSLDLFEVAPNFRICLSSSWCYRNTWKPGAWPLVYIIFWEEITISTICEEMKQDSKNTIESKQMVEREMQVYTAGAFLHGYWLIGNCARRRPQWEIIESPTRLALYERDCLMPQKPAEDSKAVIAQMPKDWRDLTVPCSGKRPWTVQ